MQCCKGAKAPCALLLCPVKKNEPGLGHPRREPSVKGRDGREKAYAAAHPVCEQPGCQAASRAVHHVGGRGSGGWHRKTAELQALCNEHHEAIHRAVLV